jgi:hypothetical protein
MNRLIQRLVQGPKIRADRLTQMTVLVEQHESGFVFLLQAFQKGVGPLAQMSQLRAR